MRNDQSGFALIESLIATVLTLIVVSAALGAFTNAIKLADTTRLASETNQTLEVAMNLMVRDFMQAGQGVPRGGIAKPSGAGSTAVTRPGPTGAALTFPAAWTTFPAVAPGASVGPVLLGIGTDLVTILYSDPTIRLNDFPLVSLNDVTNTMRVDDRTPITGPDGLKVGDLIMFSNPRGNIVRLITDPPANQTAVIAPNDPLNLNQAAAAQGTLQTLETAPNVFPPTTATRMVMVTYYIDAVTDPNLPRLTRRVNAGPPLAIALGVENLQITFDLVDGTTNPTNVDTPAAANSPHQIRKVNIFISGRSLDLDPRRRQYFRNSMATSVGLRSLSFMDRYK